MQTLLCSIMLPDVAATLRLGEQLGLLLCGADATAAGLRVVLLAGAMGSGKTTLTRGLVSALPGGAKAEVASPSFTLVNAYSTRPPVLHADLFRCADDPTAALPEDIEDALESAMRPGNGQGFALAGDRYGFGAQPLVIIEWAERMPAADLPPEWLDIRLQACQNTRLFLLTPHGPAACRVCAALAEWAEQAL